MLDDSRRLRIYQSLGRLVSRGAAEYYLDACRLVDNHTELVARSHLIAHLLREVESSLREVIVPIVVLEKKTKTDNEHKEQILKIAEILELSPSDQVIVHWLNIAGKDESGLNKWAHRDDLNKPRVIGEKFIKKVEEVDIVLNDILDKFETKYVSVYQHLDDIRLHDNLTKADIRALKSYTRNNPYLRGYFFDKLTKKGWVDALQAHGFFTVPPSIEAGIEEGYVRLPPWPEARYLARMAQEHPETGEQIIAIVSSMQDTENASAQDDILGILLALPASLSVRALNKIESWTKPKYTSLVPLSIGKLCEKWVAAGELESALTLLKNLLEPTVRGRALHYSESKFDDDYHYGEILKRYVVPHADTHPELVFLLCELLQKAEAGFCVGKTPPDDSSEIWISPLVTTRDHDILDHLVSAILSVINNCNGDSGKLRSLIELLKRWEWSIFQRLVTYAEQELNSEPHPKEEPVEAHEWGVESPKSVQELEAMSLEQMVAFLDGWKPSSRRLFEPSEEGLSDALSKVVAKNPDKFLSDITQLKSLKPIYITGIIRGLTVATKDGVVFSWEGAIAYSEWVLSQDLPAPQDLSENSIRWSQREVLSLLQEGFRSQTHQPPWSLGQNIWRLIETSFKDPAFVTDDASPSADLTWYDRAINSHKGKVIELAVKYALWLSKSDPGRPPAELSPECFDALKKYIKESHASPIIHSVLGVQLPILQHLNKKWIDETRSDLFPATNDLLFKASFESYLIFDRPNPSIYPLLRVEYERELGFIEGSSYVRKPRNAQEGLVHHLVLLYTWRAIDLSPESPLSVFYAKADEGLRAYAMDFFGRLLHDKENNFTQEQLIPFAELWQKRLDYVRANPQAKREVEGFGWWFGSGRFDPAWAVAQLKDALQLGTAVGHSYVVVETLASLPSPHLKDSLQILSLLVQVEESFNIYAWRKNAEDLIVKALEGADQDAHRLAQEVKGRLAARGFY